MRAVRRFARVAAVVAVVVGVAGCVGGGVSAVSASSSPSSPVQAAPATSLPPVSDELNERGNMQRALTQSAALHAADSDSAQAYVTVRDVDSNYTCGSSVAPGAHFIAVYVEVKTASLDAYGGALVIRGEDVGVFSGGEAYEGLVTAAAVQCAAAGGVAALPVPIGPGADVQGVFVLEVPVASGAVVIRVQGISGGVEWTF